MDSRAAMPPTTTTARRRRIDHVNPNRGVVCKSGRRRPILTHCPGRAADASNKFSLRSTGSKGTGHKLARAGGLEQSLAEGRRKAAVAREWIVLT